MTNYPLAILAILVSLLGGCVTLLSLGADDLMNEVIQLKADVRALSLRERIEEDIRCLRK